MQYTIKYGQKILLFLPFHLKQRDNATKTKEGLGSVNETGRTLQKIKYNKTAFKKTEYGH